MVRLVVSPEAMSGSDLAEHLMKRHGKEFEGTGIENAIFIDPENQELFVNAHAYWHRANEYKHIHEE